MSEIAIIRHSVRIAIQISVPVILVDPFFRDGQLQGANVIPHIANGIASSYKARRLCENSHCAGATSGRICVASAFP